MATDCTPIIPDTPEPATPHKVSPRSSITCQVCNTPFRPTKPTSRFCSQGCYRAHWRENVAAKAGKARGEAIREASERGTLRRDINGRIIDQRTRRESSGGEASDSASASQTKTVQDAVPARPRRRFIDDAPGTGATCPTCGTVIVRTSRAQKYCSVDCYRAAQRASTTHAIPAMSTTERSAETSPVLACEPPAKGFPDDMPLVERERRLRARLLDTEGRTGADWAAQGNIWTSRLQESHVLTLTGHGCSIRVDHDQLVIRTGLTHSAERGGKNEELVLSRGLHQIEAIILPGHAAGLSTDALSWCLDQDIAVYVITRDGELATILAPPAEKTIHLRRLQYGADPFTVARAILHRKFAAQEWAKPEMREFVEEARQEVERATFLDEIRLIEGRLSQVYWMCWRDLQLTWKGPGIPDAWRRFESRTGAKNTPRRARHPANAMINYALACLAGRITRAVIARGLDPDVGALHQEVQKRRDRHHLVYDIIEPLRPRLDVMLLSWVEKQTFRAATFSVDRDGVCTLHPALARVVVQQSQLPERLIEAEIDHYLQLIRSEGAQTTQPAAAIPA